MRFSEIVILSFIMDIKHVRKKTQFFLNHQKKPKTCLPVGDTEGVVLQL